MHLLYYTIIETLLSTLVFKGKCTNNNKNCNNNNYSVANTICNCHMTLLIILVFKGRFNNNSNNNKSSDIGSGKSFIAPLFQFKPAIIPNEQLPALFQGRI